MNKEKGCLMHFGNNYRKYRTKKDGLKCWRCTIKTFETVALLPTDNLETRTVRYQLHNSPLICLDILYA